MEYAPEKRGESLARVLARALSAERDRMESTEGRDEARPGDVLESQGSLDQMIAQVLQRSSVIADERAAAPAQLAELLAMPALEREATVVAQLRFQTYALATYTLERCEKVVSHDPIMAGELARLARVVAEQADPRQSGGTAALSDLAAYARAMEANAVRVAGDLRESFRVFLDARRIEERGGADPDLGARIDLLEASLRRDLRQFSLALDLLDRAERIFTALNDRGMMARAVINRANVFWVMRDLDKVVGTLRQALPLVSQDPWLSLAVRHNLILTLAEDGRAREAAELYSLSKELYLQHSDPLTTSRRLWVEGLIARELDEDLAVAERLLSQAADSLAEHGYGFDAALAGLDLVTVYAKRGQSAEVLRVASDLVQLFQVRHVHPEALAALKMVHEAAEREAVNTSLLAHAAEKIRASQVRGISAN